MNTSTLPGVVLIIVIEQTKSRTRDENGDDGI
jgi:hypothetical protein